MSALKKTRPAVCWSSSIPRRTIGGVVTRAGVASRLALATLTAVVGVAAIQVAAQQGPVVGGPNVDIIGRPAVVQKGQDGKFQLLQGDPGQRQNEVSCFVDSRDPLDMGCAYNDYTPVFLENIN